MVELIKIAALTNSNLFYDIYDAKDYKNLPLWIFEAIKAKIDFVQKDPFDKLERKALNFGHTYGHALELKFNLPHGEAVAYGMMMESSNKELKDLLLKLGFNKQFNKNDLIELIKNDKKRNNNTITMVKLIEIGKYFLESKAIDELI